ncbi:nicotinate-nucleotide--dimethylbenzimidazole phosphoribosyltransferase [Vibrio salinus]|uniref:nicotinate-nucleotide--dimethylbenzimidazole phosphoribosyltransferase n=1 Tax=Vibrio salinus TaxID=2899784 RepID=UPI001E41563A|nr:nicotinate-nucleotide--dimethylbenzimidazole phosphoribosyltransferase [Vibrio salinus]MCE0495675.1 nicotinate-nucleotide--dimethylbenzimidazole phosphoribosyltransferase [Vibrio salinus]
MKELNNVLASIRPLDEGTLSESEKMINDLVKPIGSLGRLESLARQLSGIYRSTQWVADKKKIIVMAADHGVFEEGVAVTPQSVTALQAKNTCLGLTGVCALAAAACTDVEVIDAGINCDDLEGIRQIKQHRGSANITTGPAMTRCEAEQLLYRSALIALEEAGSGTKVLGIGELGIANTTPAAAIVSVMTDTAPDSVVGLGANLPSERRQHKVDMVTKAIRVNGPEKSDPISVLSKVGGYDLAGMAGLIIGGAAAGIPVVLDGFLSYASALIACQLNPYIPHYLIPSHLSAEQGAQVALSHLKMKPYFDLEMRLGEGSGAALAMNLIEAAYQMMTKMGTLSDNGLNLPEPL